MVSIEGDRLLASILIAEDDKSVREFLSRALRQTGHDIMVVGDGQQALSAIEVGTFDLLLANIVMPQLDGIALALKVSKDHPHLPILLMTGYATERQRAHNLESLIQEVNTKPFTLRQICDTVQRVLEETPEGRTTH